MANEDNIFNEVSPISINLHPIQTYLTNDNKLHS
jgi:hypothetical protein